MQRAVTLGQVAVVLSFLHCHSLDQSSESVAWLEKQR